jgi:polyphosphate:AMP phosphotransferase
MFSSTTIKGRLPTMFESAELDQKLSKEEYAEKEPVLREALLKAQYALLAKADFPVIVLVSGVDGGGKSETANLLHEWMDPRHIKAVAFGEPSDEERERPAMWRYWRALPPKGRIGILFGSWYSDPIAERVDRRRGHEEFLHRIEEIRHFERMLVAEGALILKFWFHLSRDAQKKRIALLQSDKRTRWQVTQRDLDHLKTYQRFRTVAEEMLRETGTAEAPWTLIEGADERYRSVTAASALLDALRARLQHPAPPATPAPAPLPRHVARGRNVINSLDYGAKLEDKEYKAKLAEMQGRLAVATRRKKFGKRSLILVFEGQDAAGKGSTVRRITAALDARQYSVIPIAAPSQEELAQPYLWRFWRQLPRQGRVTIFDRSWYGRVLVERVEGFAQAGDWMRAYQEINQFESELVDAGAIVLKFWLAITREEQLRRFKAREKSAFKSFKITDEDWRNRKKWGAYEEAVCDMVERTSTAHAPWHLIPGNDKQYARIEVLHTICKALEERL